MSDEKKEWSTTPTDLGGWANRAMKMLAERDRFKAELERQHEDFYVLSKLFTKTEDERDRLLKMTGLTVEDLHRRDQR